MEIEELFGLSAHPLVVRAAMVLLPPAAVATWGDVGEDRG